MHKEVNIGLLGAGNIGSGVIQILRNNSETIENRSGIRINVRKVCDKDKTKLDSVQIEPSRLTTDANDIFHDSQIQIVIELIGGYEPARTFILEAIRNKKHVITANKAVIARYGKEIFEEAERNNVHVEFEAAVGGCIPILRALKESYAGENIRSIYGILNGTTNYILTKMGKGMGYEDALKKAQELGFAEPDPGFDVSGKDTAQKLTIMASIIFNTEIKDDIFTWGITMLNKNDLQYASELGYVIKLLAIGKKLDGRIELRVHPTMIAKEHELALVNNELNAIYLMGENTGKVMLYGKGAGKLPTAAVVVGDIIDIAKKSSCKSYPVRLFNPFNPVLRDSIVSRYYLRFTVIDKPSVLARITTVLGEHNISIAGVWQKEIRKTVVPVVMTTHEAVEGELMAAIRDINMLDVVKGESVVIRIEEIE